MATQSPQDYPPLETTIAGVTYMCSYWVDEPHRLVNVFTDFGHNKTRVLESHHPQRARDESNCVRSAGAIGAMIRGHLQSDKAL